MVNKPLISYTTDFGPGNKGHGIMQGIVFKVCPKAKVIELSVSVPSFDIIAGARIMEAVKWLPKGIHVCVVDPGVGTKRKGIAIQTKRGDFLIGPDNGVLLPASKLLGGIKKVHVLENDEFFQKPVSNIFHGRDIFMSCAAWLAKGIKIEKLGKEISANELVKAPYKNSQIKGKKIKCSVIDINQKGNLFLNILQEEFHKLFFIGDKILASFSEKEIELNYVKTFGDVKKGEPVILDDDFGRIEIALNQGFFAEKYNIKRHEKVVLSKK